MRLTVYLAAALVAATAGMAPSSALAQAGGSSVSDARVAELLSLVAGRGGQQPGAPAGTAPAGAGDAPQDRRGGRAGAREEPRHRGRTPQPDVVRLQPEGAAGQLQPDGHLAGRLQQHLPAADQSAGRRRPGQERPDHLELRAAAVAALVGRAVLGDVQQPPERQQQRVHHLQPAVQHAAERAVDPAAPARPGDRQHAHAVARHPDQPRVVGGADPARP